MMKRNRERQQKMYLSDCDIGTVQNSHKTILVSYEKVCATLLWDWLDSVWLSRCSKSNIKHQNCRHACFGLSWSRNWLGSYDTAAICNSWQILWVNLETSLRDLKKSLFYPDEFYRKSAASSDTELDHDGLPNNHLRTIGRFTYIATKVMVMWISEHTLKAELTLQ